MEQEGLGLQFGKVQAQTLVVAAAEGDPLIEMFFVFGALVTEAFRVEGVRIAPVLLHVMGEQGGDADQRVARQGVALERHVFHGTAREGGERRSHAQGLAEHPAGFFQLAQFVVVQAVLVHAGHFFSQLVLPVGMFCQQIDDGAQGAGGGVVGGEQQEDHVVHHVLIAQATFLVGGLAQFTEEVRGVAGAFLRD